MTSVGDTLRRERLKRNLGLEQISRELKISGKMLDAIESDHYDRLPGGVFAKAFVRQYAALLGLDGEELAGQVQRVIEPMAPAMYAGPKHIAPPLDVPPVENWTHSSSGRHGFRLSGSLPAAALVVVVMLICSAVYAWMQRPRSTAIAQAPRPPSVKIEQAQPPASTPSQPANQTASQPPAGVAQAPPAAPGAQPAVTDPAAQASAAGTPGVPPIPAGPIHIEIVATEPVWMLARVDGKVAFTGTLDANGTRVLDGEKDVVLRLGNAGGVTVSLNGKPVGEIGPKGQVRTVQFTSGGFQIVSATPVAPAPSDPLDRL